MRPDRMKHLFRRALCVLAVLTVLLPGGAFAREEKIEYPQDFFADAVFVGDSVTAQLKTFVKETDQLPGARFLCAINYTLYAACLLSPSTKHLNLKLRGDEVTVQEGLRRLNAKKAFVLLGLNDHAGSDLEADLRRYGKMIDHILDKNPGIILVIQPLTPIQKHMQGKTLNQKNMNAFNEGLKALCEEKGVYFLDIATPLMNEEGFLEADYALSKKDNVHMNNKGLQIWVDTLCQFAASFGEE